MTDDSQGHTAGWERGGGGALKIYGTAVQWRGAVQYVRAGRSSQAEGGVLEAGMTWKCGVKGSKEGEESGRTYERARENGKRCEYGSSVCGQDVGGVSVSNQCNGEVGQVLRKLQIGCTEWIFIAWCVFDMLVGHMRT